MTKLRQLRVSSTDVRFTAGMGLAKFHHLAIFAWFTQAMIVVTGAAVRLTSSGLGCENWPTCTEDRITPELSLHGWIEFGNRMLSAPVAGTAALALVGALRLQPRHSGMVAAAWGLVAGVIAQILIGMFVVRLELTPVSVVAHFMVSIVLVWLAVYLVVKSAPTNQQVGETAHRKGVWPLPLDQKVVVAPATVALTRLTLGLSLAVITIGTLVTASGPHGGDTRADRLDLELHRVIQFHSVSAWLLLAASIAVAWQLRKGPRHHTRYATALLLALVGQGAVGYLQFAFGVPAGIVLVHIVGVLILWTVVSSLNLMVEKPAADVINDKNPDTIER